MGAACGKPGAAAEPKTRKAAVEVSGSPPDPNAAQLAPVPASSTCPKPDTAADAANTAAVPDNKAVEFSTGDGDGVYLLLLQEQNMPSLVQQYSHNRPEVAEGDLLLLQIKPPSYVPIKESRFTLQNGKRTLKMGIMASMENANGKKRVCEAVMEFLRLACVYSGYIHAYAAMAQAPFSVLLVVSERHEAAGIKVGDDGYKTVGSAADETSQTNAGTEHTGEEAQNAKKGGEGAEDKTSAAEQKEEAAPTASESNEQQGEANEKGKGGTEGGKQTIFQDSPADVTVEETAPRVLEHLCVLRHLPEGRSPNISSVKYLIVVPFTKEKAEEAFKDGRVIDQEEVKGIQEKVDKLNGVMIASTEEKLAQ